MAAADGAAAPAPKAKRPRIPALEAVRFSLISYICVGHFVAMATKDTFFLRLFSQVNVAVGAFFVISGYVMAYTATELGKLEASPRVFPAAAYTVSRIAGFFPVYLAAQILFSPVFLFSALALAELSERAGFPAGVVNVVTGQPAEVVEPWTHDPNVRALSFTGSTEIGRLLYEQCAGTIKKLSLELGGHAPCIVFADAPMDHAVDQALGAKFATSGQDCLGANRFFVERPVYEDFCKKFAERTGALTVGKAMRRTPVGVVGQAF